MIPPPECCDDVACCVNLYDIANHILAEVYDAIQECYPPEGCCDPLAAYVTLGSGDDGIPDALTVSVDSINGSANTIPGGFGLWRANFNVLLRESGWPTAYAEGDTIVRPHPSDQARAAQHVFSMGEAIHRRLAKMQSSRAMVPIGIRCSNASIGSMTPLNPQGGVAGWQVSVGVDLPWN